MKRFAKNVLFMSLALALSLTACKNSEEEKKPENQNQQSQKDKDKDKDKNTNDSQSDAKSDDPGTDDSQKEPQIGDQCAPHFFSERCSGKDLLFCDEVKAGNGYIYVVTKEECADSCAAVTAFGATVYQCVNNNNLFDSCLEAIKAQIGDEDGVTDDACYLITPDENGDIGMEDAYLPNNDPVYSLEWMYCTKVGNKYYLLEVGDICRTCAINSDYSYTCTQDAAITGAGAKEGDTCGAGNFVPRRLDNKSALVCDEDDNGNMTVKKVNCAGNLELAFKLDPMETILQYYKGREPFCINTKEPACKADVFTCVANEDGSTDSYLLKGCADTDKGRHFVTKENALFNWTEPFTKAMVCGAKGCNQATGMCNK